MPSRHEVAYFGAGPAPLPTPVLEAGAAAFVNFEDTGISLAEHSHRSPIANRVLADATAQLTRLLDVPETHAILFCHGGGTGAFASVVLNLVPAWVERRRRAAVAELGEGQEEAVLERVRQQVRTDLRLDYLVTGSWTAKAAAEARNLMAPLSKDVVNVAADPRTAHGGTFGAIPPEAEWRLTPERADSAFVYYCDNETVDGVEFPGFPAALERSGNDDDDERPIVCDMSSNFLSRKVDVSKYGVIFGGAQKNVGITDLTILLVRKSLLATQPPADFLHAVGVWSPPSVLHWPTLATNNSLYNTLPIFSVYVASLVLARLLATHGPLASGAQARESARKAELVYGLLDAHPALFRVCPAPGARSRMNICFRIGGEGRGDEALEKKFLAGAEARGLMGLKGHRSVGGIRVSNYNAVPVANVERLRAYMEEFVKEEGRGG